MAYQLGAVKEHVRQAADTIGPKFGIKVVYGFGPGSVKGSDHPKGLALDFMTYNNMSKGESLANHVVANAAAYGVTYVIWNRRIWQGSWSSYSGPSPHTDHVHVSFSPTRGTGTVNDGEETGLFQQITDPGMWLRLAGIVAGTVLVIWGVWRLTKNGK